MHLKTSPHAAPEDKRLAIWAELQQQAETANLVPTMRSHAPSIQLTEERIQFHLRESLMGLNLWIGSTNGELLNGAVN